jgi:dipeptidyl aminopeptidase/acylaminoacyl peptidase
MWKFLLYVNLVLSCSSVAHKPAMTELPADHELINRIDLKSGQVEIYWSSPATNETRHPVIIYVHGIQDDSKPGAINFVNGGLLSATANLGYVAVGISMPGYGQSSGVPDFCGTDSQMALRTVIKYFRSRADVDPTRIILSGISCGAIAASMIGDKEDLAGMVLVSGVYDFKDMYNKWHTPQWPLEISVAKYIESRISTEGGLTSASQRRSSLPNAAHFKMPILLVAGIKDRIVDSQQSEMMQKSLQKNKKITELILNSDGGHMISYEEWVNYVNNFAQKVFKSKK